MARKPKQMHRAAHIKQSTQGTSNEISFSVLDAMNNEGGDAGASERGSVIGRISLFTLGRSKRPASTPAKEGGVFLPSGEFVASSEAGGQASSATPGTPKMASSPAWSNDQEKVARRKKSRKRHRRVAIAAIAVALVAVAAVGVSFLVSEYQVHQSKRQGLAGSMETVTEICDKAVAIDETVALCASTPLADIDVEALEEASAGFDELVEETERSLAEERRAVEALQESLVGAENIEAANQEIVFINARIDSLKVGRDFVAQTAAAARAHRDSSGAWEDILAADSLVREAATLASNPSLDNARLSLQRSDGAIEAFGRARAAIEGAQEASGADLEPFLAYLDLRIAAQERAKASDQAYLDRDKETLQQASDEYNALDAQAVALIKEQDRMPAELVEEAATPALAETHASYSAYQSAAENARRIIGEYLGKVAK